MGFEDVAVADHAMVGTDGTRYVKKGHVMGWGAVIGIAIVQRPGQLPNPPCRPLPGGRPQACSNSSRILRDIASASLNEVVSGGSCAR